jgi:NAD(P)-dependent dehydrogenase (short-subunit alcohol dehydrogenase family)
MSKMVEGKVIVVTGAGAGIGRDLTLALAREGASVVVNDVGDAAHEVAREITDAGGRALASIGSVSEADSASRIIDGAVEHFGRIDGVINNAGILRDRFFHKMSADEWDAVIKVHLYGSFYMSRAAANHFKEQGSGAFVHMTSTSAIWARRTTTLPRWASRHCPRPSRWTCRSSMCAATALRLSRGPQ